MKIEFENHLLECEIQYAKRKKISIHIASTGFITVKVPRETTKEMIIQAVLQQANKIVEKLQRIQKAQEAPKKREYQGQGAFLYLGKEYPLHQLIDTNGLDELQLKQKLKKFYLSSCKKVIEERIKVYQKQLGVKPKSMEIIESKVKWGSCSADKKVSFNYQLVMAPMELIDYVVVHELSHILHMNHDRSFWRRVGSIIPDYKKKEELLSLYGSLIEL